MAQPERSSLPKHVAIIMDGNGRWAQSHGMTRTAGHRKGMEVVREIVHTAGDIGLGYLTLFAFSSENWRRPETEVRDLLGLLKLFIRRDLAELHRDNVRIRVIGERSNLRSDLLPLLIEAEETTRENTGLTLVIAFNYGARDELARAMVSLAHDVAEGRLRPDDITPCLIDGRLDTAGIPDPDLILRTSGEERLSNFLLWQAAYSELMFVPDHWPDFNRSLFLAALDRFSMRERRFGGLSATQAAVGS